MASVYRMKLPVAQMLAVGAAVMTMTALAFFRVPILPAIGDDLHMSTTQLGLMTTVYAVGRLLMDVPAGIMVDSRPLVMIMRLAGGLIALGSLLLAVAPVAAVAYLAIFTLGTGTALTNTTGAAYFSTIAPVARRGMSISGFAAFQLGGQAFGPAVAGVVAGFGSWRSAEVLAVVVGVVVVVGLPVVRFMPASIERPTGKGDDSTGTWTVTRLTRVVLFSVPFVLFLTIGSMIQTLVPIIGDEELGLSVSTIGLAAGLAGFSRFVGAMIAGQVADRVSRKAALVPGLLLQSAGVVLLGVTSSGAGWLVSILVLGVGSVGTSIAIAILADMATPGTLGRQLGRFRLAGDAGLIIGPVMTALVYDQFGREAAVLPVAALGAVCAVAVALVVPETRWGGGARRRLRPGKVG